MFVHQCCFLAYVITGLIKALDIFMWILVSLLNCFVFFQRLYGLPSSLNLRFVLYIKILPVFEQAVMYISFIMGAFCLMFSTYKGVAKRKTESTGNPHWIDEEMAYIDRKLSNYIPEKRASLSSKELEVYISSLVTPLNQDLSFQEFQEMKEDDV